MKKILIWLTFIILAFLSVSTTYAASSVIKKPIIKQKQKVVVNEEEEIKKEVNSQDKDEKADQKSETENEEDSKEEREIKEKIKKNINNLLIESYKAKFSKILDSLAKNLKQKPKEERIKILTSLLITVNTKLNEIESGKLKASTNKKLIVTEILKHLKELIESDISDIAKEK